jgi:peptidoglycan hydrolase-like protein with peptidoglycan-binding domain
MNRVVATLVALVLVAAAGLAGWWAASVALAPPEDPLEGQTVDEIAYEVGVETIGRELRFQALAEWTTLDGPINRAVGIVTSVAIEPGVVVAAGDTLYFVHLRPVVIAVGATPMFRDLDQGSEGPDVAQLQALLVDLGFMEGEAEGVFEASTRRAVEDWQESLGLDGTGSVRIGDVMFVEGLPRPVVPGEAVVSGRQLVGGEEALRLLPEGPRFWIPLSSDQRALVPSDAPVLVEYSEGEWEAVTVKLVDSTQTFGIEYILAAPDGGPVCGAGCASAVPIIGVSDFEVRVVVIPETTGPGIPVAAIHTGANGNLFVRLASGGEEVPVTVIESTGGTAIVEGIDAGEVVLVPTSQG